MTVRHRDGIHFEFGDGRRIVADASSETGDVNVVSHAHADHTFRSRPDTVVCAAETAAIAEARTGVGFEFVERLPGIDLVPAGHVVGSRAAIVDRDQLAAGGTRGEDPQRRSPEYRRYCYTGDFSIRDRWYLEGFDPTAVAADVLVMETTYGRPEYRFPAQEELEDAIVDWIRDNRDRPLFLFGYSLGRAQKLLWLARVATERDDESVTDGTDAARDVLVSDSIHEVTRAIEDATALSFPGQPYDSLRDLEDEIVVLPSNQARSDWVEATVDRENGLKAGFSGWAVDDGFRYRGNYDVTFPLSDHCDFDDLVATVEAIDPDVVYTHHGFAEAFATTLETEHDYRARPLKRDQRTLGEFR